MQFRRSFYARTDPVEDSERNQQEENGCCDQKKVAVDVALNASHDVTVDKMGTSTTPRKNSPMLAIRTKRLASPARRLGITMKVQNTRVL